MFVSRSYHVDSADCVSYLDAVASGLAVVVTVNVKDSTLLFQRGISVELSSCGGRLL